MKLADDARQAWRWISVQCMAVAVALQGVWATLGDDMKADLPGWAHKAVAWVTVTFLVAGIGGRVTKQNLKKPDDQAGS